MPDTTQSTGPVAATLAAFGKFADAIEAINANFAQEKTTAMTVPTPEPVVAYLADARKNWEVFDEGSATPRLLAALEAAQELADEWNRQAEALDAAADDLVTANPAAPGIALKRARAATLETAAKGLRHVISRELLGEGTDHG